jgi:hypothetical protein
MDQMAKTGKADLADELRPWLRRISQALRRETKNLPLTQAEYGIKRLVDWRSDASE